MMKHSLTPSSPYTDPKYFGKHVITIDGEIFVATTGEEAVRLLNELKQKHPHKKPTLAYVPREETLILVLWR